MVKVKIKYTHFQIICIFLLFIPFCMFYEEYQSIKNIFYIIQNIFYIKSYRDILFLLIFFLLFLVFSLNMEFLYDSKKNFIIYKFFWIKKEIDCSQIGFLSYWKVQGDLIILDRYGETILCCPKIFHKKQILSMFKDIQKYNLDIQLNIV